MKDEENKKTDSLIMDQLRSSSVKKKTSADRGTKALKTPASYFTTTGQMSCDVGNEKKL